MAIEQNGASEEFNKRHFIGLSTDTKPTDVGVGSAFLETNTLKEFIFNGTSWIELSTIVTPNLYRLQSLATTNANNIKSSQAIMHNFTMVNTGASARYIKFYDKATAPIVGTDIPVVTYSCSANATLTINLSNVGMKFANGLGIAITGAMADADTTAIGANECKVAINYI